MIVVGFFLVIAAVLSNAFLPKAFTTIANNVTAAYTDAATYANDAYDRSKVAIWGVTIYVTTLAGLLIVAVLCGYPIVQLIIVGFLIIHTMAALFGIGIISAATQGAETILESGARYVATHIPQSAEPNKWWEYIFTVPYNLGRALIAAPAQTLASILTLMSESVRLTNESFKFVRTILGATNLGLFFLATIYLWDYKWRIETAHDGFGMAILFLIALIWTVVYVAFETKFHIITPHRVALTSTALLFIMLLGVVNPILAKGLSSMLGNANAAVQKFTVLGGYKTHTGTTLYAKAKGETPVLVKNDGEKNAWFSESSAPALVAGQVLFAGEDPESIEVDGRKIVKLYPCGDAADKKCLKSRAPLARWVWVDSADLDWLAEQPPSPTSTGGITNDQNITSNAPALGCEVGRVGDNGVEETELHIPACFNHQFRLRDGVKRLTPTMDPAAPVAWRGRKATLTGGLGPGDGTQRPNVGAGVLLIKINTGVFEAFTEPRDIPQGGTVTLAVNGDANQKSYTGRYIVLVEHY